METAEWRQTEEGGMSAVGFTDSTFENAALGWLEGLGYAVLHGPEIASDAGRSDPNYRHVVLERRLRHALVRLKLDLSRRKHWKMLSAGSPSPPCATRCFRSCCQVRSA